MTVEVKSPETMNLLGLLLGKILKTSLQEPKGLGLFPMRGQILVQAGRMEALVVFSDKGITIEKPREGPVKARVKGSISGLTAAGTSRLPILPLLRGELSFKGNLLFLLRFARMLRPPPQK